MSLISNLTNPSFWFSLIWTVPALLISITVHEFAHAYVAVKQGDPTPERYGRLSLNPLDHLDPIGTLMLLIFRFGWAKPVPINPLNFIHRKSGIVWTSLAGPISNILLMILSMLLYFVLFRIHWINDGLQTFFIAMIYINLALALFNLLPFPPLDGSRLITVLIPQKYSHISDFLERYGFLLLIGSLLVFGNWMAYLIQPIINQLFNWFSMLV
jgi:Zn-dependent protease